jgi:hypothetical protein
MEVQGFWKYLSTYPSKLNDNYTTSEPLLSQRKECRGISQAWSGVRDCGEAGLRASGELKSIAPQYSRTFFEPMLLFLTMTGVLFSLISQAFMEIEGGPRSQVGMKNVEMWVLWVCSGPPLAQ